LTSWTDPVGPNEADVLVSRCAVDICGVCAWFSDCDQRDNTLLSPCRTPARDAANTPGRAGIPGPCHALCRCPIRAEWRPRSRSNVGGASHAVPTQDSSSEGPGRRRPSSRGVRRAVSRPLTPFTNRAHPRWGCAVLNDTGRRRQTAWSGPATLRGAAMRMRDSSAQHSQHPASQGTGRLFSFCPAMT
jgi:hypothetical protein